MFGKKLPFLLAALLLKAASGSAQSQSAPPSPPVSDPDPDYEQVSVPVPRAVSLLTDVAKVLLSRDDSQNKVQTLVDRRRARSAKRDQSITISVPRNILTRTLGLVE